jgi:hypothetical protein
VPLKCTTSQYNIVVKPDRQHRQHAMVTIHR